MNALSSLSANEIHELVGQSLAVGYLAGNLLYSEELTRAARTVSTMGLPDLSEAFHDVVVTLMTGENSKPSGGGFAKRNNLGLGVQRALKGDFATLARCANSAADDPLEKAQTKALIAQIRLANI